MKRVLALAGIVLALSSCSWREWVSGNTYTVPLTTELRTFIESMGSAPGRSAYALGVATGDGAIAIDDVCGDGTECFYTLPDADFWMEHERMHIAYARMDAPFGSTAEDWEHWANCGAELVTGRNPPFTAPGGYDDCNDADVAKMRYVLTERLGIDFNG